MATSLSPDIEEGKGEKASLPLIPGLPYSSPSPDQRGKGGRENLDGPPSHSLGNQSTRTARRYFRQGKKKKKGGKATCRFFLTQREERRPLRRGRPYDEDLLKQRREGNGVAETSTRQRRDR